MGGGGQGDRSSVGHVKLEINLIQPNGDVKWLLDIPV